MFNKLGKWLLGGIMVVAVFMGEDILRVAAWGAFALTLLIYAGLCVFYRPNGGGGGGTAVWKSGEGQTEPEEEPRTLAEAVARHLPGEPKPDGKGWLYPAVCHDGDQSVDYLFFCDDARRPGFLLVRDYDAECSRPTIIDALERESGVMIRRG